MSSSILFPIILNFLKDFVKFPKALSFPSILHIRRKTWNYPSIKFAWPQDRGEEFICQVLVPRTTSIPRKNVFPSKLIKRAEISSHRKARDEFPFDSHTCDVKFFNAWNQKTKFVVGIKLGVFCLFAAENKQFNNFPPNVSLLVFPAPPRARTHPLES